MVVDKKRRARRILKKSSSSKSKKKSSSDDNGNNSQSGNNVESSSSQAMADPFYVNTVESEFTTLMSGSTVAQFVSDGDGTCVSDTRCIGDTIIFAESNSGNTLEAKYVTSGSEDESLLAFLACPEETMVMTLASWSCQVMNPDRTVNSDCTIEILPDAPFYDIFAMTRIVGEDVDEDDLFIVADVTVQCAAM